MSERSGVGLFAAAEGASRRGVLYVGVGMGAFVVGRSLTTAIFQALIAGNVPLPELPEIALWHFWAWAVLPPLCYLVAWFLAAPPGRLAFTATITGELTAWLLLTATLGEEWIFPDWLEGAGRVLFVGLGGLLSWRAAVAGRARADAAQARALAQAEAHRAEMAAALAKLQTEAGPPPEPPPPAGP